MGDVVRLGFVGAGGIAQRSLVPAAHAADGVVVQAIAARSLARASALNPVRAYDDYAALLSADDIDLVYIALDNGGHLPWTLAALEAGKHVICEKPLALNPADLARMEAAAGDLLLVEAFWYRWHPRTRRAEELLADLGPLTRVDADFTFNGPRDADPAQHYRYDPARGGGALYDVGCYPLSAAHLALGPLTAIGGTAELSSSGVDVTAAGVLRAESGAEAHIRCGIHGADRQQIAITGEAGRLDFGDPAFTSIFWPSSLTVRVDGSEFVEEFPGVDPYKLMIEAVADRVRGSSEAFLPGPEHSRQVAASTEALLGLVL